MQILLGFGVEVVVVDGDVDGGVEVEEAIDVVLAVGAGFVTTFVLVAVLVVESVFGVGFEAGVGVGT